jgi:uncharacterized protein
MKQIRFGRTELMVSEIAFGGIPVMRLSFEKGVRLVEDVIDRGVNFIDTAHGYGDSEAKIGAALAGGGKRNSLIISSKSPGRDRKTFKEHLDLSLSRLKTDCIDIYHLHNVSTPKDFDQITAPGGALEALQNAVQAGKVRFPAVSSHAADTALRCIDTDAFDVLQFPLNFVDTQGEENILSRVKDLDLGFLAMKPLGGGLLDDAGLCFRYLQQFDGIVPDPGIEDISELDEIITLYAAKRNLSDEDWEQIERIRTELGGQWCHRCDYCQPCPQDIKISLVLITNSIMKRMSFEAANNFVEPAMRTAAGCIECGDCVERCPYDLPIPDLLKERRKMWAEFAAGRG